MAQFHDHSQLPASIENALKKISDEMFAGNEDGFCFSVDHSTEPTDYEQKTATYGQHELDDFINFDMLGDEDDQMSGFGHLLKNTKYEDILGNGMVIKILLEEGIGQVVPENYTVLIHYIAYISNLHEPFDVTYKQGRRPQHFTLGEGELLPGLEIGVKTMRTGENARFIIKPDLAYREMGCPPRIPPNATILFDVHLVSYLSPDKRLFTERENDNGQRFKKNIAEVKKLHGEGNEQFKMKSFEKAIGIYHRAVELLHMTWTKSDEEEIEVMKLLNKFYTNLSLCYLKYCAFNKVCRMGLEAVKYSDRFTKLNAKLFFNWGKALRLLKDFSESKIKLDRALKIEPHNITIQNELRKLENDREFNSNIKHFTFDDDKNNDDEHLPMEFWEVFDHKLSEFINSDDDILTVTLNKCPDDIQLAKHKASSYNLECHIVTKAGATTNCLAIKK